MTDLERLALIRDHTTHPAVQRHAAALCVAVLDADLDAELELLQTHDAGHMQALALALARLATGTAAISFAGQESPTASARELFVRVAILNQDE